MLPVSVSGTPAREGVGDGSGFAARLRLLLSSHSCVQATVTMTATVLTAQAVNTACQDCERMSIALTMPTPAGRKKESHVVGQEPGDRSDCFRFDDFAAECCEQQYHADDAARYETARQRTDKFAGGVKQQNDENSRYHGMHVVCRGRKCNAFLPRISPLRLFYARFPVEAGTGVAVHRLPFASPPSPRFLVLFRKWTIFETKIAVKN